jgi:hypothetical protein
VRLLLSECLPCGSSFAYVDAGETCPNCGRTLIPLAVERTRRRLQSLREALHGRAPAIMFELGKRIATLGRAELRDEARVLGKRVKVKGRWQTKVSARCLMADRDDPWDEEMVVDYETEATCSNKPVTIGNVIVPACARHLARWADLVGLDWAARVGVRPYAAELAGVSLVTVCYPHNPEPSRSPLPGSQSKPGSIIEVTYPEFEALTDALLELGAPVAEFFVLGILMDRAERAGQWPEAKRLSAELESTRERIVLADGRWKAMRRRHAHT